MTMKQLKLLGVFTAFAVFIAAASVVYGGLSWTGIDPIITYTSSTGTHTVNVDVGMPPGQWCHVASIDIDVDIAGYDHHDDLTGPCSITTSTDGSDSGTGTPGEISVSATVVTTNGKAKFPVQIMISQNGTELNVCSGKANSVIECNASGLD
ncbi:MAG: hypothetical protein QF898_09970 [SAR202 cluster bacterium]|nr:hypothetical protein [SAR202 cluster bacterium]MDP6513143.1 hypothetical protein [SAR202 cluster bacterium]